MANLVKKYYTFLLVLSRVCASAWNKTLHLSLFQHARQAQHQSLLDTCVSCGSFLDLSGWKCFSTCTEAGVLWDIMCMNERWEVVDTDWTQQMRSRGLCSVCINILSVRWEVSIGRWDEVFILFSDMESCVTHQSMCSPDSRWPIAVCGLLMIMHCSSGNC